MSEKPKTQLSYPYSVMHSLAKVLELTAQAGVEAQNEASHDRLTGALNRRGLTEYLETADTPKAMLLIDVTNFKSINDTFGYRVGDHMIEYTHDIIAASVREDDPVARWGGDEFVVVLNGKGENEAALELGEKREDSDPVEYMQEVKRRIAEKVKQSLAAQPELRDVNFDLAVGGVVWPGGGASINALIAEAEAKMKAHKAGQHQNDRHAA